MDSLYYNQRSIESVETLTDCRVYVIHIDKLICYMRSIST